MNATQDAETGVYVTKDIRDRSGTVGVLRELDLSREYSGDNMKALWLEVLPNGGMEKRTQIDIVLNNQTIQTHNIMLRLGRQHLWTDINREIRDDIRQMQIRYNPSEVTVQSMTVLVNETSKDDDNSGDAVYSQIFERIDRRSGGQEYSLFVPNHVRARFLNLEAQNLPVKIYDITVDGMRVEAPMRPLSPYNPVEIELPKGDRRILEIRFRAEGFSGNNANLKVTVSKNPLLSPVPDPSPLPFPVPGPGRGPRHGRSGELNQVKVYTDDYCSNLITEINLSDSCERLTNFYGSKSVMSVKVNDRCVNTPNQNFAQSCRSLMPLAKEEAPSRNPLVRLFSDDYCKNPIIELDEDTNCDVWKSVVGHTAVWSVNVDGSCINIPNVGFSENICSKFIRGATSLQRPAARDSVEVYTDDSCKNKLTNVQPGDNCEDMSELFNHLAIWSIKFRDRCENIPNISFKNGCDKYSR